MVLTFAVADVARVRDLPAVRVLLLLVALWSTAGLVWALAAWRALAQLKVSRKYFSAWSDRAAGTGPVPPGAFIRYSRAYDRSLKWKVVERAALRALVIIGAAAGAVVIVLFAHGETSLP